MQVNFITWCKKTNIMQERYVLHLMMDFNVSMIAKPILDEYKIKAFLFLHHQLQINLAS